MHQIVFLPGLLCDEEVWRHQFNQLSNAGFQCCVADYGNAKSLTAMAEVALSFVDQPAAFIGHSMGGRVAFEVYRKQPTMVTALALLNTGHLKLAEGNAGMKEKNNRMGMVELAQKHGMQAMAKEWIVPMVAEQNQTNSELMERIIAMLCRKTPEIFLNQQIALIQRADASELIPNIRCKTLFLSGEDDLWSPLSAHEEMATLATNSTLVAIPNSGHMSTMEQPEKVSAALTDWLKENPAEAAGLEQ